MRHTVSGIVANPCLLLRAKHGNPKNIILAVGQHKLSVAGKHIAGNGTPYPGLQLIIGTMPVGCCALQS
jgi:hypothetical protein